MINELAHEKPASVRDLLHHGRCHPVCGYKFNVSFTTRGYWRCQDALIRIRQAAEMDQTQLRETGSCKLAMTPQVRSVHVRITSYIVVIIQEADASWDAHGYHVTASLKQLHCPAFNVQRSTQPLPSISGVNIASLSDQDSLTVSASSTRPLISTHMRVT